MVAIVFYHYSKLPFESRDILVISFLSTLFIVVFILQPFEWIGVVAGFPLQEILMLAIVVTTAVVKPGNIFAFFKLKTTQFFIAYIFIAWVGFFLNGLGAMVFLSDHAPKLLRLFLSYMVIVIGLDSLTRIRFALFASVLSTCIVAILCIRLRETGLGVGYGIGATAQELNWRGGVQWLGQLAGANSTGLLLVTQYGFMLTFLSKTEKRLKKIITLFVLVLTVIATFYTGSRGALLGLMGVTAFYWVIKHNIGTKKAILLGIMMLAALLVLRPTSDDRGLQDSSSNERVELMYLGLQMLKENPLLGVGYEQFASNNPIRKIAHNIYLEQVAETGLFGSSFFFLMFYLAVRNSKRHFDENQDDALLKNTTIGIWCGGVGLAICTFFLSATHFLPYIVLGLITSLSSFDAAKYEIRISELRLVLGIQFVTIGLVYVAVNLYASMFF